MPQFLIPLQPDCYYHIYNHANGSDNLFRNDDNFYYFLQKYAQYIAPVADTFAYCLMPNHFHFFIRVKTAAVIQSLKTSDALETSKVYEEVYVSNQFSNLFNAYTKAYNKRFNRMGGLFNHRFKRKKVETADYFIQLIKYIHLNPVTHGFVKEAADWKFSSYSSFIYNQPSKINKQEALTWFDTIENFRYLHQTTLSQKFILEMEE